MGCWRTRSRLRSAAAQSSQQATTNSNAACRHRQADRRAGSQAGRQARTDGAVDALPAGRAVAFDEAARQVERVARRAVLTEVGIVDVAARAAAQHARHVSAAARRTTRQPSPNAPVV